jgi:transposase
MRHKAREMLVSQRTQLLNGLRGHLTEVGVIAPQGLRCARELAELIEACDETIPFEVCEALAPLVVQLRNLDEAIARLDRTIAKLAQKDETARRLMSIPGFGPIIASAMAASVQDASSFAGPREFAAFLGLTPKQNSSGGKPKLGRISKMGNRYLRKLLVVGAHAVLFHRKPHTDPLRTWAKKLIEKKPFKLVAVALANKMARIAFAILRGKTFFTVSFISNNVLASCVSPAIKSVAYGQCLILAVDGDGIAEPNLNLLRANCARRSHVPKSAETGEANPPSRANPRRRSSRSPQSPS